MMENILKTVLARKKYVSYFRKEIWKQKKKFWRDFPGFEH
jgi:hypothetical protein